MPLVTAQAREFNNGESVTGFVDTASTTSTTWMFKSPQNHLKVKNDGVSNVTLSVGAYNNQTIAPGKEWVRDVDYNSFTIQAAAGTQQITVKAISYKTDLNRVVSLMNVGNPEGILDVSIKQAKARLGDNFLNVPTYIGDEAVHPSVSYYPLGWNGYRYWMAFTPYKQSDNQTENPSVVASNDGVNWIVPTGISNPLEYAPVGGYNSDTVFLKDPDGITLHLIFRQFGPDPVGNERLYVRSSTDGVNWSPKQLILANNPVVSRPISPGFAWDGNQFIMWYVELLASPKKIFMRRSKSLFGPWSDAVETDITPDAGRQIWHIDVQYYSGTYFMTIQDNLTDGASGNLHLAKSTNGINWERTSFPILKGTGTGSWQNGMYKSCCLPMITNGGLEFALWYSAQGSFGWKIGYTRVYLEDKTLSFKKEKNLNLMSALNQYDPFVFGDTFNRADDATGLGAGWVNNVGTFAIAGGMASPAVAGNNRAIRDSGVSDHAIAADIKNFSTQAWLLVRFNTTDNNYLGVGAMANGQPLIIRKVVTGTATVLLTTNKKVANGDRIEVECRGDKITAFINGEYVGEVTETLNQSGSTHVGLQASAVAAQFDDVVARRL
ncbi:hypothetical protein [Paenibacillus spongiae]|uniref:Uncharacterized protein n=1 Tax=Paenibacillus spongiae TaxID=2909671 RepID=A0ABY5SB95_9BACL|nr:hypothetical protein [Paenibacillus spongiae]UVI31209.1 hypothetical protein L1F29_05025 [Paenibacillus spongiae]